MNLVMIAFLVALLKPLAAATATMPLRSVDPVDLFHQYTVLSVGPTCTIVRDKHRPNHRYIMKRSMLTDVGRWQANWLRQLHHTNIMNMYDEFMVDREHVMLLEYAERGSLVDVVQSQRGRPLDSAIVMSVFGQLLEVLRYLEVEGVVHMAINPRSIYLTHDWRVKLCGFHKAAMVNNTTSTTSNNTINGLPPWTAPETHHVRTFSADHRLDVYAVGMTLKWLVKACGVELSEEEEGMIEVLCERDPVKRPLASRINFHVGHAKL